jgi:hypothetical protein
MTIWAIRAPRNYQIGIDVRKVIDILLSIEYYGKSK